MGKLVIKIPSTAVLEGIEIKDETGKVLIELPAMLLNQATREQIQHTIDAGKFEITVYE